jgi:hypothetical protein
LKLWYIDHGVKTKIHILQIFCKDMDLYAYAKRHAILRVCLVDHKLVRHG